MHSGEAFFTPSKIPFNLRSTLEAKKQTTNTHKNLAEAVVENDAFYSK